MSIPSIDSIAIRAMYDQWKMAKNGDERTKIVDEFEQNPYKFAPLFNLKEDKLAGQKQPHQNVTHGASSTVQDSKTQDENSKNESIKGNIQALVHGCNCCNVNCNAVGCHKMKRVVKHMRSCDKGKKVNCQTCKQLLALCCYHAIKCSDSKCRVPFCLKIRLKKDQQKVVKKVVSIPKVVKGVSLRRKALLQARAKRLAGQIKSKYTKNQTNLPTRKKIMDLCNYHIKHCKNVDCKDFDLCDGCYQKSNHEHKMEKVTDLVGDGGDANKAQNQNSESIQRCIQSLVHACQCRDANCRCLCCHKMKRVVKHTKLCRKRQQGQLSHDKDTCPVCKQLIALLRYHAKHCQNSNCRVPFCTNIRQKLPEQKQAQRRQADRVMKRRMQFEWGAMSQNAPHPAAVAPNAANSNPNAPFPGGQMQSAPVVSNHPNAIQQTPHQMPPNRMMNHQMNNGPMGGPGMVRGPMNPPPYNGRSGSMPVQGMRGPLAPQQQRSWEPSQQSPDFGNQQMMQQPNQMQMQRGVRPQLRMGTPGPDAVQMQTMLNRLRMAKSDDERTQDFDLCDGCYQKSNHEHKMEKVTDLLRNSLMPVWDKLERMDEAIPFRLPVDPELLQIPDYFDIVKNPMDLSTIKEKINTGEYKDPWEFCDDMWRMFDNAWRYNRKNSKVYKYCTKLSDCFIDEIDPVMRSLGYCCGRKLAFTALFCYGQPMCTIARDQAYYVYETSMVGKNSFKLMKNEQIDYEPFIDCTECGRKWHQICALHNDKIFIGSFICDNCRHEKTKPKPDNKYTAKSVRPQLRMGTPGPDAVQMQTMLNRLRMAKSDDERTQMLQSQPQQGQWQGNGPPNGPMNPQQFYGQPTQQGQWQGNGPPNGPMNPHQFYGQPPQQGQWQGNGPPNGPMNPHQFYVQPPQQGQWQGNGPPNGSMNPHQFYGQPWIWMPGPGNYGPMNPQQQQQGYMNQMGFHTQGQIPTLYPAMGHTQQLLKKVGSPPVHSRGNVESSQCVAAPIQFRLKLRLSFSKVQA